MAFLARWFWLLGCFLCWDVSFILMQVLSMDFTLLSCLCLAVHLFLLSLLSLEVCFLLQVYALWCKEEPISLNEDGSGVWRELLPLSCFLHCCFLVNWRACSGIVVALIEYAVRMFSYAITIFLTAIVLLKLVRDALREFCKISYFTRKNTATHSSGQW